MPANTSPIFSNLGAILWAPAAITAANTSPHIAGDKYFAVQLGSDVVVFIDSNADHAITTADEAILLTGRTITDILANGSNFI